MLTVVVWLAELLVSSASKIALFGSTVTLLVIVPTVGGATNSRFTCFVELGPMVPPVQSTTLPGLSLQAKPPPSTLA